MEDAIFRKTDAFVPANLEKHIAFWEQEILKDHPPQKHHPKIAARGPAGRFPKLLHQWELSGTRA